MPSHFTGSPADRMRRLDQAGRRCIGNNRYCVNAAVDEFDVVPVVDGQAQLAAPVQTRKTCGRHRLNVLTDKSVHIVEHRKYVYRNAA